MDIKTKAYLLILLALVGGAIFPVMLKIALNNGVNFITFMFFSYIIATVASFTLVIATGNLVQLKNYLKKPKEYLKIGIAGFAFAGLIFYSLIYSENFISATFATVIYRIQPLIMLIFIPFLLREKISKMQLIALFLGFTGIYIALSGGNPFAFSDANTGIILMLLAFVSIGALASVFIKRYTTNMESTMFIFNSTSLVFATALYLYSDTPVSTFNLSSMAALLYMGVPMSVGVTYFYFKAFRSLKTTFVTNIYCLSPFITALFAVVLLNETIQPYYLAIAILVAIGILIQRFDKSGGTYISKRSRITKNNHPIFDVTGIFTNNKSGEISSYIAGNNRAFAIMLGDLEFDEKEESQIFDKRKCLVFTSANPHKDISAEEIAYINDLMGLKGNDQALISMGDPERVEESLDEFIHK